MRGDAGALARQYVERLGVAGLYVADLDAIERRAPQGTIVQTIASVEVPLWLDGGIADVADARSALRCGATCVVVGLETLSSFSHLQRIVDDAGSDRVVFSLDLRDGRPLARTAELAAQQPEAIMARALECGIDTAIVLDLARVGAGRGLDLHLMARLRSMARAVRLFAGGGVRGLQDLDALRREGYDGALVASALLDGRLIQSTEP